MRVLIKEVKSGELVSGLIRREDNNNKLPSHMDEWWFDFNKKVQEKGKMAFVLVKEDSQNVIEGCMIFSLNETLGPYMDLLEVAPHNKGENGKYKRVAGCLIAYACSLSFEKGRNEDKGILTFKAEGKNDEATKKLENYYRENYGAKMNPWEFMEIYQDGSKHLIEEYLNNKEQ